MWHGVPQPPRVEIRMVVSTKSEHARIFTWLPLMKSVGNSYKSSKILLKSELLLLVVLSEVKTLCFQ